MRRSRGVKRDYRCSPTCRVRTDSKQFVLKIGKHLFWRNLLLLTHPSEVILERNIRINVHINRTGPIFQGYSGRSSVR